MDINLKKRLLSVAYIGVVFYAIHYFSLYFIFANYLDQYFSKSILSVVFALAALFSIIASSVFGKYLKKYNNEKSLQTVIIAQFFITMLLACSNLLNIYAIAILVIMQSAFFTLIWISINIFISEFSNEENTGAIRGVVLSIYNLVAIAIPFLTAQVFNLFNYTSLFVISSLALIPIFYLNKKFFKEIKEPKYRHVGTRKSLIEVFNNKDIRGIISSSFILNCFYAAVNIYLVLYLTENIGIPLILYLEIILPISMIPFILIPYNLGKYSDQIFGVKRAIIFGISLMSIILISIYIFNIQTKNIFVWIALIFIARLGATITETENYAYFYRKVSSRSTSLIALFQNMSNISYLLISLSGAILIKYFNIKLTFLFLLVGIMGLLNIFIIIKMKNNKNNIQIKKSNGNKSDIISNIKDIEDVKKEKIKIWA